MPIKDTDNSARTIEQVASEWNDFRLVLGGAAGLMTLIALEEWLWFLAPVRLMLGVTYVLFVPGYFLTVAFFPESEDLTGIERVGLSLGLSIAVVPVVALVLDQLPWGLRLWPILLGEYVVIVLGIVIVLWRQAHLPTGRVYVPDLDWRMRPWWHSLPPLERRIYLFSTSALVFAILLAAWVFLVPSHDEFVTEFYILGDEGLAENYPREVMPDENLRVTMGIVNQERTEHTYRVEIWAVDPWNDRRVLVARDGPVTLKRGEEKEWLATWQMPWAGQDQMVVFSLFLDEEQTPYRKLRLWLNVVDRSRPGNH